jgi:hypothetical protein
MSGNVNIKQLQKTIDKFTKKYDKLSKKKKKELSSKIEFHYPNYNFVGKGTLVRERIQGKFDDIKHEIYTTSSNDIPSFIPVNKFDLYALRHDLAYVSRDKDIRDMADILLLNALVTEIGIKNTFSKIGLSVIGAIGIAMRLINSSTNSRKFWKDVLNTYSSKKKYMEEAQRIFDKYKTFLEDLGIDYDTDPFNANFDNVNMESIEDNKIYKQWEEIQKDFENYENEVLETIEDQQPKKELKEDEPKKQTKQIENKMLPDNIKEMAKKKKQPKVTISYIVPIQTESGLKNVKKSVNIADVPTVMPVHKPREKTKIINKVVKDGKKDGKFETYEEFKKIFYTNVASINDKGIIDNSQQEKIILDGLELSLLTKERTATLLNNIKTEYKKLGFPNVRTSGKSLSDMASEFSLLSKIKNDEQFRLNLINLLENTQVEGQVSFVDLENEITEQNKEQFQQLWDESVDINKKYYEELIKIYESPENVNLSQKEKEAKASENVNSFLLQLAKEREARKKEKEGGEEKDPKEGKEEKKQEGKEGSTLFGESDINLQGGPKIGINGTDLSGVNRALNPEPKEEAGAGAGAGGGVGGAKGKTTTTTKNPEIRERGPRYNYRQRRPFFIQLGTDLITETEEKREYDADVFSNFSWIPTDGNFTNEGMNTIIRGDDLLKNVENNGQYFRPAIPKPKPIMTSSLQQKMRASLIPQIQNIQEMEPMFTRANPGLIRMYSDTLSGISPMERRDNIDNRIIFPNIVDGVRV